jgi:hypothetical protein
MNIFFRVMILDTEVYDMDTSVSRIITLKNVFIRHGYLRIKDHNSKECVHKNTFLEL